MQYTLKITEDELIRPPLARKLITGKQIVEFNIRLSARTFDLNTGSKVDYENAIYEVMNREPVESPLGYIKYNCAPCIAV